jgi:hypothetical protein
MHFLIIIAVIFVFAIVIGGGGETLATLICGMIFGLAMLAVFLVLAANYAHP